MPLSADEIKARILELNREVSDESLDTADRLYAAAERTALKRRLVRMKKDNSDKD